MRTSLRRQQGYLALIIAVLIVTVGFTGLVMSYKSSTKINSTTNLTASMQAYYMALSGIERAIYDLTLNGLSCEGINGTANYTNATYSTAPGQFTVQGDYTAYVASISANVGATDTTIPIGSSGGYASSGTVLLETELMNYTGINGTPSLTGVTRGAGGTTATPHISTLFQSAPQFQCVLQSVGAVPSFASPIATRTINVTLLGYAFGMGQQALAGGGAGTGAGSTGFTGGSGVYQTAIIANGPISAGTNVFYFTNRTVSASSPNFQRSSIWNTGTVTFNNPISNTNAYTDLSDGIGDNVMVKTSSSAGLALDVFQKTSPTTPLPFSNQFFQNFFSVNKTTVQAALGTTVCSGLTAAVCVISSTGLIYVPNSATPITFDVSFGSLTFGSHNNPVILIIDGNMVIQGPSSSSTNSITMNGFLYVDGSISYGANNNVGLFIYGSMALGLTAAPSPYVPVNITYEYRPSNSGGAAALSNYARVTYSKVPSNQQEQF